jgi:Mn2+/Fe2+ NRAMP family transporter
MTLGRISLVHQKRAHKVAHLWRKAANATMVYCLYNVGGTIMTRNSWLLRLAISVFAFSVGVFLVFFIEDVRFRLETAMVFLTLGLVVFFYIDTWSHESGSSA